MENGKITIYPRPEKFKAISYKEVKDRIKSFDLNKICNVWVFFSLNGNGKNLSTAFNLHELIALLDDKCGESVAFIERVEE